MNDMSSAIEDLRSLSPTSLGSRRVYRYALSGVALVFALIAYCELCSVIVGMPPPGLRISAPWALQVALPWIAIGSAFGMYADRMAASRIASSYPRTLIAAVILTGAAVALGLEALLMELRGGESPLSEFLYLRAPTHIAAVALLVAIYMGNRLWSARQQSISSVVETPANDQCIEVMTGTGRTTIRIEDIECLQADRNYINVMHVSGKSYLLRQTMATAQRALGEERFMRVHRSTIVNRLRIKERRPGGVLVLQSGRTVTVSRAHRGVL